MKYDGEYGTRRAKNFGGSSDPLSPLPPSPGKFISGAAMLSRSCVVVVKDFEGEERGIRFRSRDLGMADWVEEAHLRPSLRLVGSHDVFILKREPSRGLSGTFTL